MGEERKRPDIRFAGFNDDWEQREFKDLFITLQNNALSRADLISDTGIAMNIHYGDILTKFGERLDIRNEKLPFIADDSCVRKYKSSFLHNGDVIIADAAEDEIVGKCSEIVGLTTQTIVSGLHTIPCRPTRPFSSGYLGYYMNSNSYHDQLLPLIQGTKVSAISKSAISNTILKYPKSKYEQTSIADYLSNLENLITLQQQKYDKLKTIKKAMLEKMFPKEGTDVPEIRFAGFKEAWEQHKFCELFIERRDKTESEYEDTLLSCAIDGMFLNSELFGHFRGSTTIGYLKVKKNNLILSAQNLHLGNANVNLRFESGIISPAYKVYDLDNCYPYFIQVWVKKDATKNFFLAATTEGASQCRKNIEWNTLENQTIRVPSFEEQQIIGEYFSNLDHIINLQHQKLEKLKNLKSALLEKMFV
ncbi:restriction endonuclease subunit S [Anoxynatronum sibiricum]|uniref:Restriction endonuclease subunit S n=1 Tax=Anoxynatronum sibiricum TaxID=210623 RepID=A0ABU9W050_9CLOT